VQKVSAPFLVLKPPEIFCLTFGMCTACSATAFSRFWHPRIGGIAFVENLGLSGMEICKTLKRQHTTGLVHLMARGHQEFGHAADPDLFEFLKDIDQFPPVLAEQIAVKFPAIVDECAQEAGENPPRIEGLLSPFRVTGDPSEPRRSQRVPPVPLARLARAPRRRPETRPGQFCRRRHTGRPALDAR
jgi:hypothetical protein